MVDSCDGTCHHTVCAGYALSPPCISRFTRADSNSAAALVGGVQALNVSVTRFEIEAAVE